MIREITGRHVALAFVGAFGIIIAVNVLLAVKAVGTFPGLETRNSYVASQSFQADRAAQLALGWNVGARVVDGVLRLTIVGPEGPEFPPLVEGTLGRATNVSEDRALTFVRDGDTLAAPVPGLPAGYWNLRLAAEAADGTPFRQRIVLRVAP